MVRSRGSRHHKHLWQSSGRIYALIIFFLLAGALIIARLFQIQVLDHWQYEARASEQYNIYRETEPNRGEIFWQDLSSNRAIPLVINQPIYSLYINPSMIKDPAAAARELAELINKDAADLVPLINQKDDPYEIIAINLKIQDRQALNRVLAQSDALKQSYGFEENLIRYYIFEDIASHVTGFLGYSKDGYRRIGQYGIEEYYDAFLTGEPGLILSDKDVAGRPIAIGRRVVKQAQNGSDVILTIDQNIQYKTCQKLSEYVEKYNAVSGTVIIMDPRDGSLYAMCSVPAFNSNNYQEADIANFVNPAVVEQYEPGSIFKPITVAAALDMHVITPETTYVDAGSVVVNGYTIRNADGQAHGLNTMVDVLDKSLNTGAIFVLRTVGLKTFRHYVNLFGFGKLTGIELSGESDGDISSLDLDREIYSVTASFGQGITVTPIQIVTAYAAIARGGTLVKPMIVKSIRTGADRQQFETKEADRVISQETSAILSDMLVSVVDNGYGRKARVPGYRIAGKTGTAQIPKAEAKGYSEETIHSFVGFGPVGDDVPLFVMLVKLDRPTEVNFSSDSTAPLFGELAEYLLKYFEVPPADR